MTKALYSCLTGLKKMTGCAKIKVQKVKMTKTLIIIENKCFPPKLNLSHPSFSTPFFFLPTFFYSMVAPLS